MSDPLPKYWQSLAERASDPGVLAQAQDEFAEPLPVGVAATPPDERSRRDFFKLMGLSAAAAMVACQRAPVQKIIPYVARPDEVTPGLALWYASTCNGCSARCGVLLKTRDGRPIKVEGNDEHPVSRGGVCAVGQASVLSLYDASRARFPTRAGKRVAWTELDADVEQALRKATEAGQGIRVVLPWHLGPTAEAAVKRFLAAYPTARTVRDEPLGELSAIAEAHRVTHGVHAVPDYRFDEATVIASFGADFLGTWVSPVAFTRQYTEARDAAGKRTMSRHYQVEPMMTLTGAAADRRLVVAPSELPLVLADLVRLLAVKAGRELPGLPSLPAPTLDEAAREALAEDLWAQREGALVVAGGDDVATQVLVNTANALLGNEGRTVSLAEGTALDADALSLDALLAELRAGTVGAVLFLGANPVYTDPRGEELAALLKNVPLTLSTSDRRDETATHVGLHAPDATALESWGDAEVRRGVVSLRQPAVAPLHETRSAVESLLQWAGAPQPHYDFLRARWEAEVFPRVSATALGFGAFWDDALRRGVVTLPGAQAEAPAFRVEGLAKALAGVARPAVEWELVLYPTVAVRDGAPANNGWLQEMADPITKATWGNPACIAPARAKALGLKDGDVVKVRAGGRSVSVPVLVQAGTHPSVIAVPVGYGRTQAGRVADGIGVNVYPLSTVTDGRARRTVPGVTVEATGEQQPLALTQTHHRLEGRPHVREAELAAFLANPRAGNEVQAGHGGGGHSLSMWSGHEYKGHRWALAVDLSACTGCSACVVSCQAENNIPSVGRDEVLRRREMHWMRIDRYYQGDEANPQVVHQPMMCQHCENAPCESVCPVLATVHSSEGLNQQVYNRCVGTRYCANNCPTKVRRFNWFDYPHDEPLERMVLNPDVVVRSRGVMEKCSLCVQRIQESKAAANREGRPLRDGDIQTACQQSCPAKAIHFGDVHDPDSQVARLAKDGRAFRLLEELNIGSSITYLTKIRNTGSGSGT
ncbi:TAT-variant-translocated molybdopterin oxidoreductase [Myxococcus sp. Y35]|uniref:TAT-variant-translocated molybdopterin oxidoreductase n=1 Tax=Pseudomyxococcus flavus TaxID=3115648 RepID=UPI003CE8AB73